VCLKNSGPVKNPASGVQMLQWMIASDDISDANILNKINDPDCKNLQLLVKGDLDPSQHEEGPPQDAEDVLPDSEALWQLARTAEAHGRRRVALRLHQLAEIADETLQEFKDLHDLPEDWPEPDDDSGEA